MPWAHFLSRFEFHSSIHRFIEFRIGWWESLQETPIFDGKKPWFPVDFPLNHSIHHHGDLIPRWLRSPAWPSSWRSRSAATDALAPARARATQCRSSSSWAGSRPRSRRLTMPDRSGPGRRGVHQVGSWLLLLFLYSYIIIIIIIIIILLLFFFITIL